MFGVKDGVDDQLAYVIVFQIVENCGAVRRVRTRRVIRSFVRCWETDDVGLSTCSAGSLTDISRFVSDYNTGTRVVSAHIGNNSITKLA
ncbi:hypothetical protein A8144_03300 [Mycobacterium leprae 3125609]|nr:hypothetical protein A8144_03300 [Mycobacterium leprae 3125609]OAX70930.1 hypothetical protein A3216_08820 [Mycobacterium leprae 7935681]